MLELANPGTITVLCVRDITGFYCPESLLRPCLLSLGMGWGPEGMEDFGRTGEVTVVLEVNGCFLILMWF